jgi:hypothetical protein
MFSKPLALVFVGVGCIAAAGIGAYVAVRQNIATVVPQATVVTAKPPNATVPQSGGVVETEAIVADERGAPPASTTAAGAAANAPAATTAKATKPRVVAQPQAMSHPPRVEVRETPPAPNAPVETNATPTDQPMPHREAEPPVDATLPAVAPTVAPEPLEPPQPQFEELVVSADSVIGLQVENSLSTKTAQLEDRVEARVTRDVTVAGKVAVPAGTRVLGSVTLVERGGKIKERARLGVRFHTLVMADASRVAIQTDSIFREGEPPANGSVAKIGGAAVGGAILGAIFGGAKGAVIGGATGAAGGTAATMAGDRNPATLPAGATVTVRLTAPVTVTVER